ncbi:MAG: nucleotidyltransferase [Candidatus Latescibacteria bacterium]|nr:nucleotidyltransferase [Candidatus Latescibacterota bacterium]
MAIITQQEITGALERLGQLAQAQGHRVELVIVGGALMVLAYKARLSTYDVDAVIIAPTETRIVRELVEVIAAERGWPKDWLNDAVKGYMKDLSAGPTVFSAPGIEVRSPSLGQVLAMKLSAWRDDVDIADARRLLEEFPAGSDRETVWKEIEPYLVPGDELKAQYAFLDLWEALHGQD